MKLLLLGDIVGERMTAALSKGLWTLRNELGVSAVFANGENASRGNGLTPEDAETLLSAGVDLLTTGNHVWKWRALYPMLDEDDRILRPANYPGQNPGKGVSVIDAAGIRILAVNLQGTVFMDPIGCPFQTLEQILREYAGYYDYSVVDIHAEATAEKIALARAFDSRVTVIAGTHTHVRTADAQVLPGGTAYLTDLGMCGPADGILGVRTEEVLDKLRYKMPVRFEPARGALVLSGAIVEFGDGKTSIEPFERRITG